jgi:flagellar biosynthesis protein FlhA
LRLEPLSVEVGLGLVKLVEGGGESPLLRRVSAIRKQLAAELGYILPPVRVTDNLSLRPRQYAVLLKGVEVARYELPAGAELAIAAPGSKPPSGAPTIEPAFGIRAVWVTGKEIDGARATGCTLVDPLSVLTTHLTELIRRHAHELFSRQDAKRVLDRVADEQPRVVEDLVPKLLPLVTVQRVLQNLLRERVTIRDAVSILECLGEAAAVTRNPMLLTEYVRQHLRRSLVQPHLSNSGELSAFLLEPGLEAAIERAAEHGEQSSHLNLPPQRIKELLDGAAASFGGEAGGSYVLIAGAASRSFIRQLLETRYPQITVLSHGEIPPGVRVVNLGTIRGTAA